MSDRNTGGKAEQSSNSFARAAADTRKQLLEPALVTLNLGDRDKHKLESGYWSFRANSFTSSNSKSRRSSGADPDINEIPVIEKQSKDDDSYTSHVKQILLSLETLQEKTPSQDLIGKFVEKESFAAAFLTSEGGTIKISGKQVILYVPPGALPADSVQLVYISITPPDTSLPANEKWITPVVDCGPSGLKFQRPVLLSLPRTSNREGTLGHHIAGRRSAALSGNRWDLLDSHDTERLHGRLLIKTTHFTRFGVSESESDSDDEGNCSVLSKWLKVVAFVKPCEKHDGLLEITAQLCDLKKYKESLCVEGFAITTKTHTPAPSLLVNPKSKVIFRLLDVADTWKIVGDSDQILDCANVLLPDHQTTPSQSSVNFIVENLQNKGALDFTGTIEVYKENNPNEKIVAFLQYPPQTNDQIREESDNEDTKFLIQQPDLNPSPHSKYFMKDRRFREICIILEGMNDVGMIEAGWRALAQAIGIVKYVTLSSIEGRAHYQHKCPSTIVLDHYFSKTQNTMRNADILDALRHLSNIFQDMGNADAKRLVEEELSERCSYVYTDGTSNVCHSTTPDDADDKNDTKEHSSKKYSLDSKKNVGRSGVMSSDSQGGFMLSHSFTQNDLIRNKDREPNFESDDEKSQGQACCFAFLKRGRPARKDLPSTDDKHEKRVAARQPEREYSKVNRDSGYGSVDPARKTREKKYTPPLNSIDAVVENSV